MKSLPLLVILPVVLLAVSLPACRRLPHMALINGFFSPSSASAPPASQVVIPPAPIAEGPELPAIDRRAQVIVLGYHRFVETVRHPDTEITTAEFEEQMQSLKDHGITVISLDDFLAWRHGEKSIPPQSALITIDDGYNVAYTVAWPILKKFGYPFTLFVYTDYLLGGPKSGGGSLSWDQLAEMRDAGISIQSHTVSHADLRHKKGGAVGGSYEDWLWNELHGSKAMLEGRLGIKVTALALPFGLANDKVREVAANAGYEMLFTVNGVKDGYSTPQDALGRYMVQANQPKLFATATNFGGAADARATARVALPAGSVHPQPADASTICDVNPRIQADLTRFGSVDPASVSLRISGLGEVVPRWDPQTKIATFQAHGLRPDKYTVILTAKAEGKKLECRWAFTVSPDHDPSARPTTTGVVR